MTGELVDHYFLTAAANAYNRDILIIPCFQASCTHPPSNTCHGKEIDIVSLQ